MAAKLIDLVRAILARRRLRDLGVFVLLAVAVWVVRYWHSADFGLYEDDFTFVPRGAAMGSGELLTFVGNYIAHLYGHGRPLTDSLIFIFSHIAWRLGGLSRAYWIGYVMVTANCLLFYALLRRLQGNTLALIGGLTFAFFPADTTQAFLNHSLGLHPSLMFLLLAIHLFLSGRRVLSYVVVSLVLFTYETPFLVFLAAPLLREPWVKGLRKRLLVHALVLGVMLLSVYLVRSAVGERRAADLGFPEVLSTPIVHMIEGPIVTMGLFVLRPIQALAAIDKGIALLIVLTFATLALVLSRVRQGDTPELYGMLASLRQVGVGPLASSIRRRVFPFPVPEGTERLVKLAIVGCLMLILAYPLTFTVRAYAIRGRDTRVHFAAVVGASILFACLWFLLLQIADAYRRRRLAALMLAGWLALLAGFGWVVQKDYVLAWTYQKEFWSHLVDLIPDVTDGTAVLVNPSGLIDTWQIAANYWNMPRVLDQIYEFPAEWRRPPRVFRLTPDWGEFLIGEDGLFQLNASTTVAPPSTYGTIESANVIMIETQDGALCRRQGPIVIGDVEIPIRESQILGEPPYPHGFLYKLMIEEPRGE